MEASATQHAHPGLGALDAGRRGWGRLAVATAAAAIGTQITYPLLSGEALTRVTFLTVALFATAVVAYAAAVWGPGPALRLMAVAGALSLIAEAVGLRTGLPFGSYAYAAAAGPTVLGVPLVVPAAWTMMAGPALVAARAVAAAALPASVDGAAGGDSRWAGTVRRGVVAVLGGVTLAGWDLFLDPQLVDAGFWTWQFPEPGLPGVPGVPLTNLAGWLLTGTVLVAVLDAALPPTAAAATAAAATAPAATARPRPAQHGVIFGGQHGAGHRDLTDLGAAPVVPAALLAWTWAGSTLANLAFFDRPALAGYGAVTLGATVVPYLLLVARDRSAGADR